MEDHELELRIIEEILEKGPRARKWIRKDLELGRRDRNQIRRVLETENYHKFDPRKIDVEPDGKVKSINLPNNASLYDIKEEYLKEKKLELEGKGISPEKTFEDYKRYSLALYYVSNPSDGNMGRLEEIYNSPERFGENY